MPAWLTIAIGIAGSLAGAGAVVAVVGLPESAGDAYALVWSAIAASLLASVALVAGYRRFVQQRPILGREAHRVPTRGIGVARIRKRLGIDSPANGGAELAARLRALGELREADLITDEEFAAKRAELIGAI
jgi:hypothetical protein